MLVALETTEWSVDTPNNIYFLNKGRDKLFGYVKFGESEPQWFKKPIGFDAKGRKFLILEEQPDPQAHVPAEVWQVAGSKGAVWTVSRENGKFSCDCPASKFRGGDCKHIQEVKTKLLT